MSLDRTMVDMWLEQVEQLKQQGKYGEALKIANKVLTKDPSNKEALFQVADIQYRQWEITRAEKPIDFLLQGNNDDAMSFYVKGVLEMEKTHRNQAKKYLRKAVNLLEEENPEVMRCYGLCEYWSGNREGGLQYLRKAFDINDSDAEIILNLIEVLILEKKNGLAQKYIKHYHNSKEELQFFDRDGDYYDQKIRIFEEYVRTDSEE